MPDIVIALREKDADNLEICQMAKRLFAVKKTVCTVRNPKNVEIFELLGVDRASQRHLYAGPLYRAGFGGLEDSGQGDAAGEPEGTGQ